MQRSNGAPAGAAAPPQFQPGGNLARELRFATSASTYDPNAHTVDGVFAAGSPVRRWGFVETLNMAGADLSRVAQAQCKLLDSHNAYSIDAILGVIDEAHIENGQLVGRVRFAQTPAGQQAEGMVARGELNGFSIGYSIQRWIMVSQDDSGLETWCADAWTLLEVTLCSCPADPAATVRAVPTSGTPPENQHQEDDMTRSAQLAAAAAVVENPAPAPLAPEVRATPVAPQPAPVPPASAPASAENRAAAAISARTVLALLQRADFFSERALAEQLIESGESEEAIMRAVMEAHRVKSLAAGPIGGPRAQITRDEGETRRCGMVDALVARFARAAGERNTTIPDHARDYGEMGLVEIAAECTGYRGPLRTTRHVNEVLDQAFTRSGFGGHSTSDFPGILLDAMNKRLLVRYQSAAPSYRRFAAPYNAVDFRAQNVLRAGDFPSLLPVGENGEIKSGTFGESKEQFRVSPYGVRLNFSRVMIVNDNLFAIDQTLNSAGVRVSDWENAQAYASLTSASAAGPTLLTDSKAVFHTDHGNLAGTGTAITVGSIGAGRAAMMKQTTIDGIKANFAPLTLLSGPDKATEAEQLITTITPATQGAAIPESVRRLTPVSDANITGYAWYLFADPLIAPTFVYGYLEGYEAPRLSSENEFGVQGMSVKLEHDFGVAAIDYRGGYRNPGSATPAG